MTDASGRQTPATIHDVAHVAGVTIGTVSKALSGNGRLRPETRERVRAAADRLEYRPNDLAHSLTRGRTCTIGLLTSDLHGRFSLPLLAGIERSMGNARILVFLCNAQGDPARELQYLDALSAKRVDGLIVAGTRTDPRPPLGRGRIRVPVVYAFTQTADPGTLCVIPDDYQGGQLAIEHLIDAGRRHFAHITGPENFEAVRDRLGGMWDLLTRRGLDRPVPRVLHGPWLEEWGYRAAKLLLKENRTVDAIFCGSDVLARGAVDALRERGVCVPDDIAVVGFDNWPIIAATTRPPLTTVDMNIETLGRLAGESLLDLMDGQERVGILRQPCRLVCRSSCGGVNCTTHRDLEGDLVAW